MTARDDLILRWVEHSPEHFAARVSERLIERGNGCRVREGTTNDASYTQVTLPFRAPNGRGRFSLVTVGLHRAVLVAARGSGLPDGWDVDHLCGMKACGRLEHLEAVPAWVNVARATGRLPREYDWTKILDLYDALHVEPTTKLWTRYADLSGDRQRRDGSRTGAVMALQELRLSGLDVLAGGRPNTEQEQPKNQQQHQRSHQKKRRAPGDPDVRSASAALARAVRLELGEAEEVRCRIALLDARAASRQKEAMRLMIERGDLVAKLAAVLAAEATPPKRGRSSSRARAAA